MGRERISEGMFTVSSEPDDGGVQLRHKLQQCDWYAEVGGWTPGDLLRRARGHAEVCDGEPQPRLERVPNSLGGLIPGVWSRSLDAALNDRLTATTAFVTGMSAPKD